MDMNNPYMANMFNQWMNNQNMNMMNNNMDMNNPYIANMFNQWISNQNLNMMNMSMNMNNPMMFNLFMQFMQYMQMMNSNNQNNFNMNNQQFQQNQNNFNMNNQNIQQTQNNEGIINIVFSKDLKNYIIKTKYNESFGAVMGKYISQTKDNNVNMYIFNGKKINESLTVGEAGLMEGSVIYVVVTKNIIGALKVK